MIITNDTLYLSIDFEMKLDRPGTLRRAPIRQVRCDASIW